jgi:hypothetical protein
LCSHIFEHNHTAVVLPGMHDVLLSYSSGQDRIEQGFIVSFLSPEACSSAHACWFRKGRGIAAGHFEPQFHSDFQFAEGFLGRFLKGGTPFQVWSRGNIAAVLLAVKKIVADISPRLWWVPSIS